MEWKSNQERAKNLIKYDKLMASERPPPPRFFCKFEKIFDTTAHLFEEKLFNGFIIQRYLYNNMMFSL